MNHNKSYRKLGRRSDHRKAMFKNMANSILTHEKIETTVTRAKEIRKFVDRMITFGKKGSLNDRRLAYNFLRDDEVVYKLFNDIAPRYKERNGGYTRIIKTAIRKGDSAQMAIIELV